MSAAPSASPPAAMPPCIPRASAGRCALLRLSCGGGSLLTESPPPAAAWCAKNAARSTDLGRLALSSERNAREIETYLLLRESSHRSTGATDNQTPLSRKERGSSRIPVSRAGEGFLDHPDYAHARRHVEPALAWLMEAHFPAWSLIQHATYVDPGALAHWRKRETEDDEARALVFDRGIHLIAERIEARAPGTRLRVPVHPRDEPAASKREAWRMDTRAARRALARRVYREMERGAPKSRAVETVAKERDRAPSTVWEALREHAEEAS